MRVKPHPFWLLVAFAMAMASLPVAAQTVIGDVTVGANPLTAVVNPATNTTFVVNDCGDDVTCNSGDGSVTVINGANLSTQNIVTGDFPYGVAINALTNTVYVATCASDNTCDSPGALDVINGGSLAVTPVTIGIDPQFVAVNPVTGAVYVTNYCGNDPNCVSPGTVSVINGTTVTATVTVGNYPLGIAVDPVANLIYVINNNCNSNGTPPCPGNGTVSIIDGVANVVTQTVAVGAFPFFGAVDPVTSNFFVANECGTDLTCSGSTNGTVTAINGVTMATSTINTGIFPLGVTLNAVTSTVFVANQCGSDPSCGSAPSVSVISESSMGVTNNISVCSAGVSPGDFMSVDRVTNQLYVPCDGSPGTVTTVNGATGATSSVNVDSFPNAATVNEVANTIYAVNSCGTDPSCSSPGTTTAIAGIGASAVQFVPVAPCRLIDTRSTSPIPGGTYQSFAVPQLGGCNIPATASAYSLNVTVAPQGPLGYLTIWPTGEDQPVVSTMNSLDGRTKANAAIVPAGGNGAVSVFVSNTSNVILDIDGYFAPVTGQTFAFYPLTPCRVVDTRGPNGDLGGPFLSGGQQRNFPVLESTSCIPTGSNITAYSFNFTVVPPASEPTTALGYLTVGPQGPPLPVVSTLNNLTATTVANAAIVPAGTGGGITVLGSNDTDVVIDIDGYFAAAGTGGLSLYPVAPCRALDTRGVDSGQPFSGQLTVPVTASVCAPPSTAQAYVFNATVVPPGALGYLSLWPDGENQPVVSTLNAVDGAITSNMAIVPTMNGSIDAFASNLTQLILDISSYYAP